MSDGQLRASDPRASVWVSASAGTGKTKVLTDRVLRLLLSGTPPERILCLTFTKAAAAEMAIRLDDSLGAWTGLDDGALTKQLAKLIGAEPHAEQLKLARQLFARVLDTPGGLKVQTIHSFCQSLLGRFPLESGLAPHFKVMDERSAAELLQAAREQTLAQAGDGADPDLGEALRTIAALTDERGFAELMAELARQRGRFERLSRRWGGARGVRARLRVVLGLAEGETRDAVISQACAEDAFDGQGLRRAAAALAQGGKRDVEHGARIARWLDDATLRGIGFEGYCEAYFKQKGERRTRLIGKASRDLAPQAEAVLAAEAERLEAVLRRLKTIGVRDSTAALLDLAEALFGAYAGEKRRRAVLDYEDLILLAGDLLRREGIAPWVLYKLDGGLDHILLDEGQDTNPEQWQVVAALAEEFFAGEGARRETRTVFAVGDAKQSIYSFQRADPDVFGRMRDHFSRRVREAEQSWRPLELARSYRSVPAVLEVVDEVFANERARDGLFSDQIRHIPNRIQQGGLVELWPLEVPAKSNDEERWQPPVRQEPADSPHARLAARIAERIGDWLQRGEVLEARGRVIRAGDVMILVQRRAPFVEEMVRALKSRGVAVAGADRMILSEQLAVMDLVALARFLLLPEDDLTLAVVLKSPLIGLDEEALFKLAYGRGRRTLWQTLKWRRGADEVFARAHDYLAHLFSRVDMIAPYELYAEVLGRLGGRRRLVARLGHEAGDPLDEFLGLALAFERTHPPSLQGFLHWLESGQAVVRRDMEQGRDEVRVITVHGAKGLQAPVVFLPDTCRVPQGRDGLLWLGHGAGDEAGEMVLWPARKERDDPIAAAARQAADGRRIQEYHRLLYVAMTRAEDRLYVCGWETRKGRGEGCWYDLAHEAMVRVAKEVTLENGARGHRYTSPQEAEPTESLAEEAGAGRLPALPRWARRPPEREPSPPRPLVPSAPEGEDVPVRSPLRGDGGAGLRRGRLVHRLLELLPELAPEHRPQAARHFLAGPAHGLGAAEQAEIAAQTLAVLEDPSFARLFGAGSRAEVALTGIVGARAVSGQVDRLLVGDDEVLVVDYKTNRLPPEREDEVPEVYLKQMAAYRAVLRLIYPRHEVRCALLWTEGPRLMGLSETALNAASP